MKIKCLDFAYICKGKTIVVDFVSGGGSFNTIIALPNTPTAPPLMHQKLQQMGMKSGGVIPIKAWW